jgi:hypothetical protein
MTINYREPYWVKFQWDMSTHHDHQYVTEFNKSDNDVITNFLYQQSFVLTCEFKIGKDYQTDELAMVFGKSGKNMGLCYNTLTKNLSFDFWIKKDPDDQFITLPFNTVTQEDVENGLTITIIRNDNKITIYKNFEEDNSIEMEDEFCEDYKRSGFFVGCSNPTPHPLSFAGFTQVDINHFSIILNSTNIKDSKNIFEKETDTILKYRFYGDILCLYDFKTTNNLNFIYDESKNSNFLEKIPKEFVL